MLLLDGRMAGEELESEGVVASLRFRLLARDFLGVCLTP